LLDRLAADNDNIRAAIDWTIGHGETERALRFAGALWRFWQMRGDLGEGAALIDRILAMPGGEDSRWRPNAVGAAGSIAWWQADLEAADRLYAEQVRLARGVGDPGILADALFNHAHTLILGPDRARADAVRSEAKQRYAEAGDPRGVARVGWIWANMLVRGDMRGAAEELSGLLETFRGIGDDFYAAMAAGSLAWVTMTNGDFDAAARHGLTSVVISREMGDNAATTIALRELSLLLRYLGLPREATVLDGAFDALCDRYGVRPPPVFAKIAADMEQRLGRPEVDDPGERDELLMRGAAMTLPEAVDYVAGILTARVARTSG
jgi:non-specific serine/threonine protein kinase